MLVTDFRSLIAELGEYHSDQQTTNQYSTKLPSGAICRENLLRYLTEVSVRRPKMMLMDEAPGYRGCRLTGIPFTSEQIMLDGVLTLDLLGTQRGYRLVDARAPIRRESSATIVWDALVSFGFVPLLWAAFPFHPSNRLLNVEPNALGRRDRSWIPVLAGTHSDHGDRQDHRRRERGPPRSCERRHRGHEDPAFCPWRQASIYRWPGSRSRNGLIVEDRNGHFILIASSARVNTLLT